VRTVREFLGAMTDAGIKRGILVTLCGFTAEAKRLADKHGIEMVEATGLAKLLQATDAGRDPNIIAIIRDTRKYCPKCEAEMVLRTATRGRERGQQFWGCSRYPKCRFTIPLAQGRSQSRQSRIQRQPTVA
jgi:restriction system protein